MINEILNKRYGKQHPYKTGANLEDMKIKYGHEEMVKVASNENPFGASPKSVEAMIEAVSGANIYPDPTSRLLREKLALKLKLTPEQIIVSNGASGVLRIIAEVTLEEGDEVIYGNPTFIAYHNNVTRNGGIPVEVPLTKDYVHDLDAMFEAITDRTKIVMVCNPNNPTGTIVSHDKLIEFLERVPKNILIVIDEAYIEFVSDSTYKNSLYLLDRFENLMVIRTFSKLYGLAGVRVGYGMASEKIISTITKLHQMYAVNAVALKGAEAAIDDVEFVDFVKKNNTAGREYLSNSIKEMGYYVAASETNFIFVDMKMDTAPINEALLKRGCILRPFGNFLRITVGTPSENKKVIMALGQVMDNLKI